MDNKELVLTDSIIGHLLTEPRFIDLVPEAANLKSPVVQRRCCRQMVSAVKKIVETKKLIAKLPEGKIAAVKEILNTKGKIRISYPESNSTITVLK